MLKGQGQKCWAMCFLKVELSLPCCLLEKVSKNSFGTKKRVCSVQPPVFKAFVGDKCRQMRDIILKIDVNLSHSFLKFAFALDIYCPIHLPSKFFSTVLILCYFSGCSCAFT